MIFLNWKSYMKQSILFKTTFEIPFFLTKKVREHMLTFDYYQYDLSISCMINR